MAKKKDDARRMVPLHVFLLKDDIKDYTDAMRTDVGPTKMPIDSRDLDFEAELYLFPPSDNQPNWVKFLRQATPALDGLVNMHNSAILFVRTNKGRFAFPFGQGHHKVNETAFVRDFGKLVVVNMVKPESISSLSMQNFQHVAISTKEEATRATNLETFAANVEEDLLKMLAGVPEDDKFASAMAGSDSLHLTSYVKFEDLGRVCKRLWKEYKNPGYRTNGYGWVDNLQLITDRSSLDPLDAILIQELKKQSKAVQISAPDEVRNEGIGHYAYSRNRAAALSGDWLRIEDLYSTYAGDLASLEVRHIKNWQIEAFDKQGASINIRSVYSMLLFEAAINNDRFVLYNGKWYKASKPFVKILNDYLEKVRTKSQTLIVPAKGMKEDEYVDEYKSKADYTSFHKSKFLIDGRNIEPCDLFDHSGRFIHVKCWTSSATFSHLLLQGNTSAQVCTRLSSFRQHMLTALKSHMPKPDDLFGAGYVPNKFKVTFALLREEKGDIPFFSKLNLFSTGRRIESLGYTVEYELIRIKRSPTKVAKRTKP